MELGMIGLGRMGANMTERPVLGGDWLVEKAAAATVLAHALFARYASRQQDAFANKVIPASCNDFGGHAVKKN
jgi:6-phosphogluconate dehydrogenase (decarboxylating)